MHYSRFETSWQGSKDQRGDTVPRSGEQKESLLTLLETVRKKQIRLYKLLLEASKLYAGLESQLSKFGLPHQKPLPFVAAALRLQKKKIYRGNL